MGGLLLPSLLGLQVQGAFNPQCQAGLCCRNGHCSARPRARQMSDGTTTPDRCPTCFICCESEAERPEDALLATGCACSRAGASGGRAHLQCIVAAAKHDEAHWTQCSVCKQQWSGPLEVGLSRARYESLSQSLPAEDLRRVIAKLNLASCQKKNGAPGALADATQLYEEVLETWRRTLAHAAAN